MLDNAASVYEICEPGRLIVAHTHKGDFADEFSEYDTISVVRNVAEVSLDCELYEPVVALTKELDVLFHHTDGGFEVTVFRCE
ncbi:hypothetical protein [Mycobacterium avium]|uniref:hypothetical protein n=1 Tax=Mycobacterium avium TaxID=1764 RepID=UPI000CE49B25|nr:hypothetical protein [Mycobacterium avium]